MTEERKKCDLSAYQHELTTMPFNSLIGYIKSKVCNDINDIAIEYYGSKITRKKYWDTIEKYRSFFYSLGIKKGDPVTICMLNSPEYEFVYMALLANGSIANTVSNTFLHADIKKQTIERNSTTLILSIEFAGEMREAFEQLYSDKSSISLERIIFTTCGDYMPDHKEEAYNKKDFSSIIKNLNLPHNIEVFLPGEMKKIVNNFSPILLPEFNLLDDVATYSNTEVQRVYRNVLAIHIGQ